MTLRLRSFLSFLRLERSEERSLRRTQSTLAPGASAGEDAPLSEV